MKPFGIAAVILGAGLVASPALAQPKPAGPTTGTPAAEPPADNRPGDVKRDEARQRYQRGLQLFNEANFEAARVEFERAYQLAPSYKILYNIGLSYEQLGDYVHAQSTLQNYLETGGIDISEERRSEVAKELAQIRPRIARVTIHTNVSGVDALVDDVCSTEAGSGRVTCAPFQGESRVVLMNPGRRRVTLRKDGYLPETTIISVAGSDQTEMTVTMKPLAKEFHEKQVNPFVVPLIVGGAVTVAGLTTTAVLGFLTNSASKDQDALLNKFGTTPDELQQGRSKTRELASYTTGFGIGTGVALGVTAYFAIRTITWKRAPTTVGLTPTLNGVGGTF